MVEDEFINFLSGGSHEGENLQGFLEHCVISK